MKKVLLSAYACLPNHGSEEENGWNYATLLSQEGLEVHCLTRDKFRDTLEATLLGGYFPNLTFHYVGVPGWLERAYGNLIGLYVHYLYWQWQAARLACRLDRQYAFDLVHHVSYSSLQLGSFMYKVGKPFIFGPVGGGQEAPPALKAYFGRYWSREWLRSRISRLLLRFNPGFYQSVKQADMLLISNTDTWELAKPFRAGRPAERMLDSGLSASFLPSQPIERRSDGTLNLLWVGRLMPRKALELTIHAFSRINPKLPITLTIVGGKGEMADQVPTYIRQYGVGDRVRWAGHVSYQEVREFYHKSDVFFFTSLRDSCPMQIMEAMAYSMPTVTLALHGQNELVNETNGIKVPVSTQEQVVNDLARAIEWLHDHPAERLRMGQNAYDFAQSQMWERKIRRYVDHIYPALTEPSAAKVVLDK